MKRTDLNQVFDAFGAVLSEDVVEVVIVPPAGEVALTRHTVPADGATRAVAEFGTTEAVYFVVDGVPVLVQPVDGAATLELAADAPGAVTVQVQDKTFVIVAEAVA